MVKHAVHLRLLVLVISFAVQQVYVYVIRLHSITMVRIVLIKDLTMLHARNHLNVMELWV